MRSIRASGPGDLALSPENEAQNLVILMAKCRISVGEGVVDWEKALGILDPFDREIF